MSEHTLLDLVRICDNFRLSSWQNGDGEQVVPWRLTASPSSPVIGLLRPQIVEKLMSENDRARNLGQSEAQYAWCFSTIASTSSSSGLSRSETTSASVSFASWISTPSKRTDVMREMCERWRDEGFCEDVIGKRKWRNEMYPVYVNPFGARYVRSGNGDVHGEENYAFEMERAACALFGVATYGVHMTIYEEDKEGLKVWVPTRAKTKPTWPGYLDNSVAGGIPSGMSMFESLVKESMEEASIEESVIRTYAKAAGAVSYFFRTPKGWLQPEIEYVYDLKVPQGEDPERFKPKPLDGEVECFELLPLDQVLSRMRAGLFKYNCAPVIIDFLIRVGYVHPDNEPDYAEILTRLHGRFDYERWGEF